MSTNPFIYGRSIQPPRFHNHIRLLRRVLGRLERGEETAIIGQPTLAKHPSSTSSWTKPNKPILGVGHGFVQEGEELKKSEKEDKLVK
ncbi:MAG: hypothetical protein AAF639_37460 [Chloroflexota bacterium]